MVEPTPVVIKPGAALAELDLLEIAHDHSRTIPSANAVLLAQANKHRTSYWIVNASAEDIHIGLGYNPSATTGIRLVANGGALELNKTCLFKGRIFAIAISGAANQLLAVELESRYAY